MSDTDNYLNDPKTLIRDHYPLQGVVAPLVALVKTNPHLAEAVIELAMVYAINATYRKMVMQEKFDERPIAPGTSITFADLRRNEGIGKW